MNPPSPAFDPIRFSTKDLTERDRLSRWREVCGRTMMKVDMEPLYGEPFRCTATLRALPGLAIATIDSSPNRLTRTSQLIADGNDDLLFVVAEHGGVDILANGRETTLQAGNAILLSSADPSTSIVHTNSRFLSFAIPNAILAPLISDFDRVLASVIPDVEAIRLLTGYARSLADDIALCAPDLRLMIATHIRDLVAAAVGPTRDAEQMMGLGGVRAAKMHAIKSDIARHATQQSFSINDVAARCGFSPRYIRRLFEISGTTFTEFVLEQRLRFAHRLLGDPGQMNRTISVIAFDAGFNDLSYFNRSFRRYFGMTPSDARDSLRRSTD